MRKIWILPLLLLLLIAPASAIYNVTSEEGLDNFYLETPEGTPLILAEVNVRDLAVPSNTSFLLNAGGVENYYIWVNLTRPYLGASVRAEGSITKPDGNITVFDETQTIPLNAFWNTGKASVIIQWTFFKEGGWLQGFNFVIVPSSYYGDWRRDVDFIYHYAVYSPQYVGFSTCYIFSDQPFGQAVGWFVTVEEWEHILAGDISFPIGEALNPVGDAIWSAFLATVSAIPVIGPVFSQVFDLIGMIALELVWLLDFIIVDNWLGTLILIEFLAISEALIYGQKRTNVQLMRRVAHNHVLIFTALVMVIMFLYENIILRTLSALGDIIPG